MALTVWIFVNKVMSLLFKTSSKFVIAFFPERGCSHHLQWFWSPNKIKSVTASTFSLYIFNELPTLVFFPGESHEQRSLVGYRPMGSQRVRHICVTKHTHTLAIKWWDLLPWSSFFECWVLGQLFHSPLSPSSRGSLVPFHFLSLEWYHLHIWGCWYFSWQSWFQLVIHPAQHSPVYKLNKQGDTIQPCCTSLPILTLYGSSLIRSNGFT